MGSGSSVCSAAQCCLSGGAHPGRGGREHCMTACPIPHERIRRNMMIRTLVARRAVRRVGSPSERRATPFPHRPGLLLSTLRGGSIVPPTMLKCKLYDFKWRRKRNLTLIVDKVNKTNICQPGQKVKGHSALEVSYSARMLAEGVVCTRPAAALARPRTLSESIQASNVVCCATAMVSSRVALGPLRETRVLQDKTS